MDDTDKKNTLAELAERLKNGIYNNPNDARFDKPVVCASLDANDVLKTPAHRRGTGEVHGNRLLQCERGANVRHSVWLSRNRGGRS